MNSLKTGFMFSVMIVVSSGLCGRGADPNVNLQFGADGKFKIAQFTDLHWEVWQPDATNQASLDAMASVLDAEHPDMVVLTGDIIPTMWGTVALWQRTVKVMQDRQIPWAVTLGNHDTESIFVTPTSLISSLSGMPYSLVEAGPSGIGGYANYLLDVKDSSGQENAAVVYCMDSQKDGLTSPQVQWYRDQSAAMTQSNGGSPLPSLAYFHIPLPEYDYFGTTLVNGQIGQKGESVYYEDTTGDMFDAIQDSGDVMGVFCGHDHWNDFALFFDDVCLAYGRKTGVNGYGTLPRGGRIVELTEGQPGFDSWIRIQDGSVVDPFHFQPVLIPGDCNNDGIVDDVDASVLASHWHTTIGGGASVGDFDGDGMVNDKDASILASHWHYGMEAAGEGSVPEPSTLALLLGAAVMGWFAYRRRRRVA